MTAIAGTVPYGGQRAALRIVHTIFCLGLNLAITRVRTSRYARYVMALLILNEIRGAYVVYTTADQLLMPWIQ
ncbi:hypothetical protein LZ518_12635 [Sphingomonas sp. RB56-2]|uniref:Uncharacterized protein n=1 Tax=Sphingomonas brevis TaxID=2908206 RepID=A0ABT0SC31_9SPHN|nr:hypothetical protein [Sphingomonas brevis]MCL6741976.1 hypothetical protein [Sphingomonas brevis]